MNPLKLDLRSLALFRIGLSLILIFDLYFRIQVIPDFYVDTGLIPRGPLLTDFANPYFFSIFNIAGKSFYIYILSIISGFCYLNLLIGFRTRFFSFLSWFFFISFSARAPIIAHGGDDLIRMALFWMMFLPSHAYYSVDSALDISKENRPQEIFNITSVAFMMQLILMYIFTALLKNHPIWTEQGTALYYTLELDQFLTPLGVYFKLVPQSVLKLMTHLTYYAELIIPILIFIPFKNSFFRWVSIFTFITFHLGLFLFLYLGTFPWICLVYWLAFIPGSFWNHITHKLGKMQTGTVIFYDADCGYCLKIVYLLKTFLILPFVEIKKAQDESDILKIMKKETSWVILNSDQIKKIRFDAFLELLKVSPFRGILFLFSSKLIKFVGNSIYEYQANKRSQFSSLISQFNFTKQNYQTSRSSQVFVLIAFAITLYWNVAKYKPNDSLVLTSDLNTIGTVLRLHQQWTMFAPYPAFEDGWVVVEAQLFNEKVWDIFNNQPFTTEKPQNVADSYDGIFWRKYFSNLIQDKYENHRLYFGQYLCRTWNSKHIGEDRVNTFQVYFMLEKSTAPGNPKPIPEKTLIWDHYCFSKPS